MFYEPPDLNHAPAASEAPASKSVLGCLAILASGVLLPVSAVGGCVIGFIGGSNHKPQGHADMSAVGMPIIGFLAGGGVGLFLTVFLLILMWIGRLTSCAKPSTPMLRKPDEIDE